MKLSGTNKSCYIAIVYLVLGVLAGSAGAGVWVDPNIFDVNIIEGYSLTETLTIGNDGVEVLDFMVRTRQVSGEETGGTLSILSLKGNGSLSISQDRDFTVAGDTPYKPGRLIVRFAAKSDGKFYSTTVRSQILTSAGGGNIKRDFELVAGLSVVELPAGLSVEDALQTYNNTNGILYAEPDYEVQTYSTFPDDTLFNDLWGMHNTGQTGGTDDADIDAPQAWDIATGSDEIIVAVIDTGVDYTHPDLAANMWTNEAELNGSPGVDDDDNGYVDDIYGYDFRNNDGDPMDDHYHGTHCAGTIGGVGNNGEGVAGVNWTVRIMAIKFLSSGGSGSTSDAIKCVEYSTLMGANLSSNSWGGGGYSQGLKDAIDAAGAAGMLFVAASGNDNENCDIYPHYPSSYDSESLVSVMSTDKYDNKSGFSNWGPTSVDLGAPGSNILSCKLGGGYKYASGTSMATPHIAGACALLWSMNPAMSNTEVKDILLQTVDPTLSGLCVSEGRLNLYNAILETKAPWLKIEPESGTIGPGESNNVNVTFNAFSMQPGIYEAEIMIISNDPCSPEIVPVTMTVSADDLQVSPADGFESSGTEGGPFEPECVVYTLTNINGTESVNWTTLETKDWLSVEPNEGVLDPCDSIEVSVCISADADLLDPNLYTEVLTFQNTDSNSIKPRSVTLTVKPPDCFTESFDETDNDLGGLMVTFTPDGSIAYYEACREEVDEFPTDPNGGTYVELWDDDYAGFLLGDGKEILFYGIGYNHFYIGSNGYITFDDGDLEHEASLENHFNMPRISGLFTDLDPPDDHCISYKKLDDRVVITFENVPIFGDKDATNSFQIEMFFVDGTIRIIWLKVEPAVAVAGLSRGKGLPPVFFEESNLNEYPPCWPCGDFDRDYFVNFKDFAVLAMHWLEGDCGIPYWCGRTDLDFSRQTDMTDLGIFTDNWLAKENWWLQPIAHWKFDEGTGSTAYDSAGNNDCNLVGEPTWVAGYIGTYALDFDGDANYVNRDNFIDLSDQNEVTISAWMKNVDDFPDYAGVTIGTKYSGAVSVRARPDLKYQAVMMKGSASNTWGSSVVKNANTWYHVVGIIDNISVKIYLDGVDATDSEGKSGSVSFSDLTGAAADNLYIGAEGESSSNDVLSQWFNGIIDDVRVYDRALSADEIWQLYQEGLN